jgi:hypothetical protein
MPIWMKIALALIATLAFVLWLARSIEARSVADTVSGLKDRARRLPTPSLSQQALESLPPPVLRYLIHALPSTVRALTWVQYQQQGTLRTNASSENWMKFTASQVIAPGRQSSYGWPVWRLRHFCICRSRTH